MKKYIIGAAVGFVFLAYSLVIRNQYSRPIIAPSSLPAKNNSTKGGGSASSSSSSSSGSSTSSYKDGAYTGNVANAFYGNIQVSATISKGKITSIDFLQYPNENPNSLYINQIADPYLKQEAIQAQNSNVSLITGATLTSQAFIESLSSALSQAHS